MRPGKRSSFARRWADVVWQGLVSFGTLHLHGETLRAEAVREDAVREEHGPQAIPLDVPPPGHPERLRPDLPFSPVEIAMLRDLRTRGPVR